MPTQVQSLITPVYDAVVEVPANGEVITEASLINMAVALGNRIEFVRNLSLLANLNPENVFSVRDDFTGIVYDSANNFLYSDLIWKTAIGAGTPTVTLDSGSAKNPGNVAIGLPAGATADQLSVALQSTTSATMTFAGFDQIIFVTKVIDNAGNPGTQFQVGMCQAVNNMAVGVGGTDSIRVRYSKAESANWLVNTRKASVGAQFDSGVPFVSGEFIVVKFKRNAALGIDVSIDGNIVHTINLADLPAGSGTLGFEAFKSGSDVFACTLRIDLASAIQMIADRSGA